jgi:AP-3 complex subunit sigma
MVLQTNMNEILARIEDQNKIQKSEAGISAAAGASRAVSAMKSINLNGVKDKVFDLPSSIRDFKF